MTQTIEKRKIRADKKRDVKPTIPIQLYETVSRLSYITSVPIKDVGVIISKRGLYSTAVLEYLSSFIKRDYWANNNVLYAGHLEGETFSFEKGIQKRRITMRFSQKDHDQLARLAYSLDIPPSSATGALLALSVKNTDIINSYISNHVKSELDAVRMKQLKEIYKYITKNNPYNKDISFGTFISILLDEVKESTFTVTEKVKSWIDERVIK
ncbi:hypothetical protein EV207_12545 [Scopulibacillus darangshiensis]|uniref:Uncharacterized protein n=1 Tax=Scopulibacillus darangshiensis TaxID=442528 RepID=A0A4R2NSV7_9BACL|nr:hypothetical protein [Scopulibacillus darangshiensis]TCP24485.1 hypothetical protein EV207_12545 [Scopulibacillus darangshiensis]